MRRPSSPRNSDIAPNARALPAAIISRRSNVLLAVGARTWHDAKRGESLTNASGLDEGTAALVERPERVFGLDRGDELEIVPIVFRFVRGLGSVEIHRVELAPVDADRPLAEQRVVGRERFHLVDELDAIRRALSH